MDERSVNAHPVHPGDTCPTRACRECGESIQGSHPRRKFCGTKCLNLFHDRRKRDRYGAKVCSVCGQSFLPRSTPNKVKTCSADCKKEGIRRQRWGKKNPNFKGGAYGDRVIWDSHIKTACVLCGGDDRLRIHHIIYRQHVRKRNGNEWDPRNGMTLCMSCHSRHHTGSSFRISVKDIPEKFFEFGRELLGDYLPDYLMRFYDDGGLEGLLDA